MDSSHAPTRKGKVMIGNIIFMLLIVVFIGFGITLMIEEKKNFKRLKDIY